MYRSAFVSIIGRPNAGKSTLLNSILGSKLCIVTPKAQTTRHKIVGIRHLEQGQLVFLDTPGLHQSSKLFNQALLETAFGSLDDADIIFHLIDAKSKINEIDLEISQKAQGKVYFVLLNKIDKMDKNKLLPLISVIQEDLKPKEIFPLSALTKDGVEDLVQLAFSYALEGPQYYPEELYTTSQLRFMVSEIIREKAFLGLKDELPYSLTVQIETFKEEKNLTSIEACLIVERESQKKIVLGKNGETLKDISQSARLEIEKLLENKVFLRVFVKVVKNWTRSSYHLNEFGIESSKK